MSFDNLTDEQKAKARAATTPEEIVALAREEGYELSDDELEAISGGGWCWKDGSPCNDNCGVPFGR